MNELRKSPYFFSDSFFMNLFGVNRKVFSEKRDYKYFSDIFVTELYRVVSFYKAEDFVGCIHIALSYPVDKTVIADLYDTPEQLESFITKLIPKAIEINEEHIKAKSRLSNFSDKVKQRNVDIAKLSF